MTKYVLGFLFKADSVVLVAKQRPAWQKGKLNGVGGKVEAGESPEQAIVREFREETGATVEDWRFFAELRFREAVIYCYTATAEIEVQTITDEAIGWYQIGIIRRLPTLKNLRWLIPLALDSDYPTAVITDPS